MSLSASSDTRIPAAPGAVRPHTAGVLALVGSASCFGLSVVFAKQSYASAVTVSAMLSWRFVIAAAVLWVVVAVRRAPRPSARALVVCAGLGAFGYAAQSGFYFSALARLDASLAALLLYTYPALVTLIAVGLGRERPELRKLVALGCSGLGLVLLLGAGGRALGAAPAGVLLALGAAVTYSVYITVSATVPRGTDLFWMSAVVCSGAAVSLSAVTTARGGSLVLPAAGWPWVVLLAVVSTVAGVALFFGGLRYVEASTAAILSCVEPVVATLAGVLVYSEHLGLGQLAGGLGVLGGVVVLQLRVSDRAGRRGGVRQPVRK